MLYHTDSIFTESSCTIRILTPFELWLCGVSLTMQNAVWIDK